MSQTHDFPFGIMDVVELLRLRVRRHASQSVYVDCPICGDKRGKMNVNYEKDIWRCNYCGEKGGMLKLYGMVQNVSTAEAYREICDALSNGIDVPEYQIKDVPEKDQTPKQADLADAEVVHQTLSALFDMLTLSKAHREHLITVRGLSNEQIDALGYKSTPPFYLSRPLTDRLMNKGYTVQGVPGFFIGKDGKWTVRFNSILAGFIIPIKGVDGRIRGAQIRLDVPLKNEDDDPDKEGSKYVWLSSAGKEMGVSSGSPVHFVGDPHARTVYITEGCLKADVAHCLMNRSFAAIAGANNTEQLDLLFAYLKDNGTEEIIEAEDIDKFRNQMVHNGILKINALALKNHLRSRPLFWNPNYKGIDDWQLGLRCRKEKKEDTMNFRERFIRGLCDFDRLDDDVAAWHEASEQTCELREHLGFTEEEYTFMLKHSDEEMKKYLLSKQVQQHFRIYQLDISGGKVRPFAFDGIKALHKAEYTQPPAAEYNLVYDGVLLCDIDASSEQRLKELFECYGFELPEGYPGRNLAPSDVVELYDSDDRRYFYRDKDGFTPVQFSPFLAKPLGMSEKK